MSDVVTQQGLNRIADTASQTSGYNAARYIRTFTVDDSATALTPATTDLGSPTNVYESAFDATPTRTGQVVTHVITIPAASAAFEHKRLVLHDDTVANVTGTSNTVVAGIDGLSFVKPADVPFEYQISLTYSDQTA